MLRKSSQRTPKRITAQAMVEFALALPILLLVVYGLLETGRLLFIYASVVTAARQAARYGSASGDIGTGRLYYNDCAGIQAAANRVAFIQRFSAINIAYDTGPGTAITSGCPITDDAHPLSDNNHRIRITVSAQFVPIVPLVPFRAFTITSTSNRTILTGVSIAVDPSIATITAGGSGALTMVKSCSPNTFSAPGQVINYNFHIANVSSDSITAILVNDPKFPGGVSCPGGMPFVLAAGDSKDCTASYTTTAADVAAAVGIQNTATATGTDMTGGTANAVSTCSVGFSAQPALSLVKSGALPDGVPIDVGVQVTYTFTLTNSGNVALIAPFVINDAILDSPATCSGSTLAVGASMTCTGHRALTKNDINAGQIDNSATATGKFFGFTVTSNTATATVLTPTLLLTATADKTSVTAAGQTVKYTYTVKNRSPNTLSNITVTDTHGLNNAVCVASLAPNQTATCTTTNTYTVTQADMDASSVLLNSASASAGHISSNVAGVTVTLVQTPVLTLVKTASPDTPAPAKTFSIGNTIRYTYTFKNDLGNVTLKAPFVANDDKLGAAVCTVATGTLPPSPTGSVSCYKDYTITQADLDAGSIVNHATATAVFSTQTVTSPQATKTVITFTDPRISLLKTADVTFFTAAGDSWHYTYSIKNTGGQPLVLNPPFTLIDNILGSFDCGGSPLNLPIGSTVGCKVLSYTTNANDVTNKGVTNTVNLGGAGLNSTTPALVSMPATASLKVPLFVCDTTTVKGAWTSPAQTPPSGGDVTWTVTNSTGLPIHIASMTVSWADLNAKLKQIFLNGLQIYSGSANSGIVVPGSPWTLNLGGNPLRLTFNPSSSGIRVVITFTEATCKFALDSSVP